MEEDLKIALENLKKDGVEFRDIKTRSGDTYFTVCSRNWKTEFGANDMGFWIESQKSLPAR